MRKRGITRVAVGVAVVATLLVGAAAAVAQASAGQEKKAMLEAQDTMASALRRMEGKTVRVRLAGGGDEVVGKLESVGKELAHLSGLQGREFFDAVVRIDQVAAVSVQVRTR